MFIARFREQKSYVCVNCGDWLLLLALQMCQAELIVAQFFNLLQKSLAFPSVSAFPYTSEMFGLSYGVTHSQWYKKMHFFVSYIMVAAVNKCKSGCSPTSTPYQSSRGPLHQCFVPFFGHVFFKFCCSWTLAYKQYL